MQRIKSFSKSLDYINGWYDCVEGGEEKNSNIPEYDIAIIKANIFSLKYLYELSIHYFGFDNDELKTCTEWCDEAETYFYSNVKGWEYH